MVAHQLHAAGNTWKRASNSNHIIAEATLDEQGASYRDGFVRTPFAPRKFACFVESRDATTSDRTHLCKRTKKAGNHENRCFNMGACPGHNPYGVDSSCGDALQNRSHLGRASLSHGRPSNTVPPCSLASVVQGAGTRRTRRRRTSLQVLP